MSNLNDFVPVVKKTKVVGTSGTGVTTDQTVDMTGYTDAVVYYDDPGTNLTINFTNVKNSTLPVITKKTLEATSASHFYMQLGGTGTTGHQIPFGLTQKSYLLLNGTEIQSIGYEL